MRLFSVSWALKNNVKIYPFPEKPKVHITIHRWYFLRSIPRPGRHVLHGGARMGRRLFAPADSRWQPRPLDFRKPLLCRMFLKGIPSWKAIQPRWHPPSTVVEGKAVPLQGSACSSLPPFRSLLLASCSISSQQWYQRVAKGNPRTAKPILDINSLPRLRWYFGLLCMVFAIVYFQLMRSAGILPWKVWYLSRLLFTSDNSYENRLIIHRKS